MASIVGDSGAALAFLERWAPSGPWALTGIAVDKKSIETRTFWPKTRDVCLAWIGERNGRLNLYFHVNPVRREISKKAEREDIESVSWLHVDIDPRAREDIESEQRRALGLLTSNLPAGVPLPTVIVFSGGGYQGFWKLQEPIPVGGDLARAEDAKRYNQQLEILFGADNCHNIDRIMRLPGTVNIPDIRKKKKGRKEALASLVEFDESRVYPLQTFRPAPAVQLPDEKGFGSQGTVQVSGNVERLSTIDELDKWGVTDRVKIILVQGKHPEERKEKDDSRSAWLFDALCQLARAGVPDDVVFSIVTDPEFGISESVLDKGANASKYALRQMERAKEQVEDPWLRELNERFAVIGNMGGKCRVIEEQMDHAMGRPRLTKQSFDDFRNRYMHIKTKIGEDPKTGLPIMAPVGKWWLAHEKRRQYDAIVFAPGREVPGAYNLWKGFSVPSQPGDCSAYLDHIFKNVCDGNQERYDYLIQWMARVVQHPDTPGEVAVVLRGGRGVGKSIFAKEFGKLFGRHYLQISNPSHLVGNFNAHLRDVVVLFADEAFYAGDRKHASILKTLITEETITIEAKGVDAEAAPNFVHLIMASNDQHVVPAGGDERRFMVLDVGKENQQDSEFFGKVAAQMNGGGRAALLHHLLTMDLTGYEVRRAPRTDALHEQKLLSLTNEEEWWFGKLEEGRLLRGKEGWPTEVLKEALVDDYVHYADRFRLNRRGSQTALGRFLGRVTPRLGRVQRMADIEVPTGDGYTRVVSQRAYFYTLPDLAECRAKWVELYGETSWLPVNEQMELVKKNPF